jgi:hypothetical protein
MAHVNGVREITDPAVPIQGFAPLENNWQSTSREHQKNTFGRVKGKQLERREKKPPENENVQTSDPRNITQEEMPIPAIQHP